MKHAITIRFTEDGDRCGTCLRPVGWTAFRSKVGRPPDEDRPDERVVAFIRHWPERPS